MSDVQKLAEEIRSCLVAGWSASVGASGNVYVGEDSMDMINGDPIVYRKQAGRCALTDENMLACAEEAIERIEEYKLNESDFCRCLCGCMGEIPIGSEPRICDTCQDNARPPVREPRCARSRAVTRGEDRFDDVETWTTR